MANLPNTTQAAFLAVVETDATKNKRTAARLGQAGMLAVVDDTPFSPVVHTPQMAMLAVVEQSVQVWPQTSQMGLILVYGDEQPEDFKQSAWSFILDGHKYYVLRLGDLATVVYDFTTGQWSRWETAGYTFFNASYGQMWNDIIVAAGATFPTLWEIATDAVIDEGFRTISREATAIIPANLRQFTSMDALYLTASSGYNSVPDASVEATLTLDFSDDRGNTWTAFVDGEITMNADDFTQEFAWLSLGSFTAPGRILRVRDTGGPITIESLDARLNGEE